MFTEALSLQASRFTISLLVRDMTPTLGVIGAGAAAAAATYIVENGSLNVETTIFEKSRGVCGRAASRRRDDIVYDYGANYLKDAGGRVSTLITNELSDGLVEVEGPIRTFDADGAVSEKVDRDERRWTYADGITRLAKHLFEKSDAEIQHTTRIADVRYANGWALTDADGTEHGPFDALLVNPPAPQTAVLLRETGVEAADRVGAAAAAVAYRTVWTAVLGYSFRLDVPYYALVNADKQHDIGWISREECKPGHVPDGASVLIVQAGPEWSSAHYDAPPAENISFLSDRTAAIIGNDDLATPDWSDHQGWRYALPETGLQDDVRAPAAEAGLYVTGDWVAGEGRLHAAVRNGLQTGEMLRSFLRDE